MNLEFTDLGKIKEQKKPFAWFPFIPRNEVTILVSNGGVGKTFFGLDILARLSNGVTMPNKSQGAYKPNTPTAIVSSETSKEEFAKRLRELFGKCPKSKKCSCVDVDKVSIESSLEFGNKDESISIDKNIFDKHLVKHISPPLEMIGKDKGFVNRNTRREFMQKVADAGIKVVLFDPLKSYLGNAYASQHKMRALMEELSQDLKEFDLTFIGIWHLNKLGKVQGTTEVKDSVRSVVRMANNLNDERISFIQVEKGNNIPTDVKDNILAFDKDSLGNINTFGLEYNPDLYDPSITMEEHIKGAKRKVKNVNIQTAGIVLNIIKINPNGILLGDWRINKPQKGTIIEEMRSLGFGNLARYLSKPQTGAIDVLIKNRKIERINVKNSGRGARPSFRLVQEELSNKDIVNELLKDI